MKTSVIPDIPGPDPRPRPPQKPLPALSCDAHAHIFGPPDVYPYHPDRSYTPHDALRQDYIHLLHTLGFGRCVLVQPSVYGTDNRLMCDALSLASTDPAGIEWRGVAVLDDAVADAELERLHALGVRAVRLNMQHNGGIDFATASKVARRIAPLGWHMQFLVDITRFDNLASRLAALPTDSVIDHMGHFPAVAGPKHPAFIELLSLMQEGRTWVKLSGPNRTSALDGSPYTDTQALAEELLDHMPKRLVFGTDWPHVQLPTSMPNDGDLVDELYRWLGHDDELAHGVLVDNPARLYSFDGDFPGRHASST